MRLMLYQPGDSFFHKLSPGIKLLAIAVISSLLMFYHSFPLVGLSLIIIIISYYHANIALSSVLYALKPMLWFLFIIFLLQIVFSSLPQAIFIILRLFSLLLLTLLVTFTTKTSDMLETIEWTLSPLALLGIRTDKISLAISIAIRFVPIISLITKEVLEAQKVRGLEKNLFAMIIPVTLRTLKMADDIADAIDARFIEPSTKD